MTDHAAEARRLLALIDDDAADGDTLAAIATTHALLAIADRLGTHPVYWPCPTATALGATGRSEWDDAATHAPPQNRCGSTGGDPTERCIHTTGHTAMHTNRLGDLW